MSDSLSDDQGLNHHLSDPVHPNIQSSPIPSPGLSFRFLSPLDYRSLSHLSRLPPSTSFPVEPVPVACSHLNEALLPPGSRSHDWLQWWSPKGVPETHFPQRISGTFDPKYFPTFRIGRNFRFHSQSFRGETFHQIPSII